MDFSMMTTTICKRFFTAIVVLISLISACYYPGSKLTFLVFCLVFNIALLRASKLHSFFEFFLSVFLWLGFWLKICARLVFYNNTFHEPVGSFNYSPSAFDDGLLVAITAGLAFICASLLREFIFNKSNLSNKAAEHSSKLNHLTNLYSKYRSILIFFYLLTIITVCYLNLHYGFYQRGLPPQTILPYGLNGVINWLLSFGFTSLSTLLIFFELKYNSRLSFFIINIVLLETFISNVSLLSRGMILNVFCLSVGILAYCLYSKNKNILTLKTTFVSFALFLIYFASSIILVNNLRFDKYHIQTIQSETAQKVSKYEFTIDNSKALFIDRWVGAEGALAMSSYNNKSWTLWNHAWREKFSEQGTSFYDKHVLNSNYNLLTTDPVQQLHFVTLPGIVAFLFYPGSYTFLFIGMIIVYFIGYAFENASYYFSYKNIIFSSLISFVVASRFAHFGYAPSQSYLILFTIIVNILGFNLLPLIITSLQKITSKIKPSLNYR